MRFLALYTFWSTDVSFRFIVNKDAWAESIRIR